MIRQQGRRSRGEAGRGPTPPSSSEDEGEGTLALPPKHQTTSTSRSPWWAARILCSWHLCVLWAWGRRMGAVHQRVWPLVASLRLEAWSDWMRQDAPPRLFCDSLNFPPPTKANVVPSHHCRCARFSTLYTHHAATHPFGGCPMPSSLCPHPHTTPPHPQHRPQTSRSSSCLHTPTPAAPSPPGRQTPCGFATA